MSNVIDIQQFLVGKTLSIPPYQRDYAWNTSQVEDLFEDVSEAISTSSPHYLGTVVLCRTPSGPYEVVDGQQRLSTLLLVIQALLEELPTNDAQRIADTAILLRQGQTLKLDFGNNRALVHQLLVGGAPDPQTAGQRKLHDAYMYARDRAHAIEVNGGSQLIKQWLDTLKTLEIIQFVAEDTGRAIRMFQTVNDRGLPLQAMDKAKALLVLYSNRHLGGEFDEQINVCFGHCFAAYDAVREFVRRPACRINNIARDTFDEDDLLRYHYLSYSFPDIVEGGDYMGTTKTVFDKFLKGTLKQLSQAPEAQQRLRDFIEDYITDLSNFCRAFQNVVESAANNPRLYKMLIVLGISARLYPLLIRLHQRGLLFAPVNAEVDLLRCLEICDVRVYKTRGTDPARDIGDLSHQSRNATVDHIANKLRSFTSYFMPNGQFLAQLGQDMYHNAALPLMMLAHDEQAQGTEYDLPTLMGITLDQITREHILAQAPTFSVAAHGFDDEDEFQQHLHQIGVSAR